MIQVSIKLLKISCLMLVLSMCSGNVLAQAASKDKSEKMKEQVPVANSVENFEIRREQNAVYLNNANELKNLTIQQPQNEQVWLELIQNTQYGFYNNSSNQLNATQNAQLNELATEINANVPNTFTAAYSNFIAQGFSDSGLENLEQAKNMAPENVEWLDDYVALAELQNDENEKNRLLYLLKQSGKYNAATQQFAKNTLLFAPNNSVVVTNGHEDEYPLEIAMLSSDKDVETLHVRYLANQEYRNKWFEKMGLSIKSFSSTLDCLQYILDKGKSEKPVYLALTLPPDFLKKNKKKLSLRGTLLGWQTDENIEETVANYQSSFNAQHTEVSIPINRNYILLYSLLRDYYNGVGQSNLANVMQAKIDFIKTIPRQ